MGILLYLDLEFWEWTLKTLTPSLQENAIYFTTRSYLTLTLFLRAQRLLLELTHQTMENRKHLLLNCDDRLILYFLSQYEKHRKNGSVTIGKTRDEIANTTGFHVKTINRNIKRLQVIYALNDFLITRFSHG